MEFRHYMMSWSGLDPDHYLGLPSLAYDIFLYKSGTKLELINDIDKVKFFEDGIRGGLSFAAERFTDTRKSGKTIFHWVNLFYFFLKKNPYLCIYIFILKHHFQDINNLYGGSQAEALPISDFDWHPNPEKFMNPEFIKKLTPDDPVGYWLECDIDFDKKLRKKRAFNLYPPLPETKVIDFKMLSPKAKKLLIKKVGKTAAKNYKSKKLISTLEDKKKYKIHYLNLQQALKFGCKLKKVHRVIEFKQKKFSKDFLNFMTQRRKNSKTKLEERLCKGN